MSFGGRLPPAWGDAGGLSIVTPGLPPARPVLSRPAGLSRGSLSPLALPSVSVGDTEGGLCVGTACLAFRSRGGGPGVVVASL